MTKELRARIITWIEPWVKGGMFGDGLEDMYVLEGMQWVGLNNMTDEDLLNELCQYVEYPWYSWVIDQLEDEEQLALYRDILKEYPTDPNQERGE